MIGHDTSDEPMPLAQMVCPEVELLLICSRVPLELEHAERLRALVNGGVAWDYLLRVASHHGLAPLVYWHLARTCPERVPGAVLGVFRSLFRTHFRQARFLSSKLLHIRGLLEAHAIPTIPYKGPTLALRLYGHLSLRPFCDLDLLVRRGDVLRALHVLESAGYRSDPRLSAVQQAAYLRSGCEFVLRDDASPSSVELHWQVVPQSWSLEFDFDDLLSRVEPIAVAGVPLASLTPEDLLLVLCVHGCKHIWEKLRMVSDVAQLLRACSVRWERILPRARELGIERALLLGLTLAHGLLRAPVPDELRERALRDRRVPSLAVEVARSLCGNHRQESGPWRRNWFALRCRERLTDRARYVLRSALTPGPEDWFSVALPPACFPLYRILRPVRLLKTHGLPVLGRLVRRTAGTGLVP